MNISEIRAKLINELTTIYSKNEAKIISDWVVEYYTGKNQLHLIANKCQTPTDDETHKIFSALTDLLQHKPIQYVLNEAWFKKMKFFVDESVLIPRPETEELVDWILQCAKEKDGINILDIGTGSGCIAIALKKALQNANVTAIDYSKKVLSLAQKNAEMHQANINFYELDFLNELEWDKLKEFDLIVSNPPYIPQIEREQLDKNVLNWEPEMALFVPDDDPLIFYRKIAAFGKNHLKENGEMLVEINQNLANEVKVLFNDFDYNVDIKKDIFENYRMVKITKTN